MAIAPVVPVGICKVMFSWHCGDEVRGPIISCNVVDIAHERIVQESTAIDIAGGMPGETCFYYKPPNTPRPSEVTVTTCAGINPELDAMTGRLDFKRFDHTDPTVADPDQTSEDNLGVLLTELKGNEANCFCACTEEGEACTPRLKMTVWRMAFCIGDDGQRYPAGKFWIQHYSSLEVNQIAGTTNSTSGVDEGTSYGFTAYTDPDPHAYTIPRVDPDTGVVTEVPLLPAVAAKDGCLYEFTSDICPPGECGCGSCASGQELPVTPPAPTPTPPAPAPAPDPVLADAA